MVDVSLVVIGCCCLPWVDSLSVNVEIKHNCQYVDVYFHLFLFISVITNQQAFYNEQIRLVYV